MLHKAAEDWNIDLSRSWMIGDCESDLIAGKRAGCTSVHLCADGTASNWADYSAPSLLESISGILGGAFRPKLEREAA